MDKIEHLYIGGGMMKVNKIKFCIIAMLLIVLFVLVSPFTKNSKYKVYAYSINTGKIEIENVSIEYPVIEITSNNSLEKRINNMIYEEIYKMFDIPDNVLDTQIISIEMEVSFTSKTLLSVKFFGFSMEKGEYLNSTPIDILRSLNLDMRTGEKIKLNDSINIDEEFLTTFKQYGDTHKDLDELEESMYLDILNRYSDQRLLDAFRYADTNISERDYVYTYLTNNELIISMPVMHQGGDHTEIYLSYEEIKRSINNKSILWENILNN